MFEKANPYMDASNVILVSASRYADQSNMLGMNNFSDAAALESHEHDTIEVLVAPSTLDLFASNMWRQCALKAVREDAPHTGDQVSTNLCFRCGQSEFHERASWM
jgi:hypothetical protein